MDTQPVGELRFPSKRDVWLMIIVWLATIGMIAFSVFLLFISALVQRTPHLKVQGDGVARDEELDQP